MPMLQLTTKHIKYWQCVIVNITIFLILLFQKFPNSLLIFFIFHAFIQAIHNFQFIAHKRYLHGDEINKT